jgi:ATP-binding cassette subfamily B protein
MEAPRLYRDLVIYGRLLRRARPCWLHMVGIFVLTFTATPLALLTPLPLKIAVDSVIGSRPLPGFLRAILPASIERSDRLLLIFVVALVLVVAYLTYVQQFTTNVLSAWTGEKLLLLFRADLFRHVQRLSLAFHDSKGTADSSYRIQYDASSIQGVMLDGMTPFLSAAFTLVAMIYVTARLDTELALVALVIAPLLFILTDIYRRKLRKGWHDAKKLESSAMSIVQEVLTSLRVVKAFGQEDREHTRYVTRSGEGMRARVRLAIFEGSLSFLFGLITSGGTAAVLYIGVRHVQAGTLTLGSLLLIMGYLTQLYAPLNTISKSLAKLQSALASADRAFTLLDQAPEVSERPDARPLKRAEGAVVFEGVTFGYDAERPVLHEIDFAVAPGARIGIAGTTGAGKTTLVSLLTRFYDPTSGRILLDGVDVRDFRLEDLRNQFAIVLQEPVLFSSSIVENIAYARPEASFDEIMDAARAANAHDFILMLPHGYDTEVGERGMQLSGGERQRISLARAFLKNAPILILDEPTSSVDMKTEAGIIDAMDRLMSGRTTFMIAHRLSTLESCDVRLQLEHGRLVDASYVEGEPTSVGDRALGRVRRALAANRTVS